MPHRINVRIETETFIDLIIRADMSDEDARGYVAGILNAHFGKEPIEYATDDGTLRPYPKDERVLINSDVEITTREEYEADEEDDDDDETATCRTEGCDGDPDDGEGWDGYCGDCAD